MKDKTLGTVSGNWKAELDPAELAEFESSHAIPLIVSWDSISDLRFPMIGVTRSQNCCLSSSGMLQII